MIGTRARGRGSRGGTTASTSRRPATNGITNGPLTRVTTNNDHGEEIEVTPASANPRVIRGYFDPNNPNQFVAQPDQGNEYLLVDGPPVLNNELNAGLPGSASNGRQGSVSNQNGDLNGRSIASESTESTVDAVIRAITTVMDTPRPSKYNIPMPKFTGDPDTAFDFMQDYENAAEINGWDERRKLKFFSASLESGAKVWFRGLDQTGLTWDDLKQRLFDRYLPKDQSRNVYQRFTTAKQKSDESASDFMSRVIKLKKDTGLAITDDEVITTVRDGLAKRDYKLAVMSNSANLSQVMEVLKELDKMDKSNSATKTAVKVTRPDDKSRPIDTRRRYGYQMDRQQPLVRDQVFTKDNRTFRGRGRGHFPSNTRGRYRFSTYPERPHGCWTCGSNEHFQRQCPKGNPYQQYRDVHIKAEPSGGTSSAPRVSPKRENDNNSGSSRQATSGTQTMSQAILVNQQVQGPEPMLQNWAIGGESAISFYENAVKERRPLYEKVPIINITIAGHIVTALCDSGATATAVNTEFAQNKNMTIVPWSGHGFRAIDSRIFKPKNMVTNVNIQISDRVVSTDVMLIDDLWPTVVIGGDCLEALGVITIYSLKTITFLDDPMLMELIQLGRQLEAKTKAHLGQLREERSVCNNYFNGMMALYDLPSDDSTDSGFEEPEEVANNEVYPLEEVTLDPLKAYIIRFECETKQKGQFLAEVTDTFAHKGLDIWPVVVDIQNDFPVVVHNKSLTPIVISLKSRPIRLIRIENQYQILTCEDYLASLPKDNTNNNSQKTDVSVSQSKCIDIAREDFIKAITIGDQLTTEQRLKAEDLLIDFRDRFYFEGDDMGQITIWKHRIDTGDSQPISHPPYRTSQKEKELIEKLVKTMLTEKAIRPSCSPWASPIVLVPKKGGGTRFCVNYKALNSITKSDVWPMPNLEDAFECLGGCDLFSTLDGSQMFWQIPVEENSIEKTAFICHLGLFEFTSMPYGLKNSPSSCARVMNIVFAQEMRKICYSYIDDLITYSNGFDEHLARLRIILERLREYGIKLNPRKCQFFKSSVVYLSHVISKEGIRPDQDRLKALTALPRPTTVKGVKAFVNSLGWYRRFIENFAKIAEPLNRLTRTKNAEPFAWGPEQESAFITLKEKFTNPPVIVHYDSTKDHELRTDASLVGLGALLVQYNGKELEGLVCAVSRQVRGAELKYAPTDLECLCVVWAVRKLRPYLHGKHFRVATDCHALCTLLKKDNGNARLARWSLELQAYSIDIVYRSGIKHTDADLLSRCPLQEPDSNDDSDGDDRFITYSLAKHDDWLEITKSLEGFDIIQQQRSDPHWGPIIQALEDPNNWNTKPKYSRFALVNNKLFLEDKADDSAVFRLCVPKSVTQVLMRAAHDVNTSGHLGRNKVFGRLRAKYYWPGMYTDISNYVKSCEACQKVKMPNYDRRGPVLPMNIGDKPMSVISIDLVGKLPETNRGNKYVLTINCTFTKFAMAAAIPDATSATVIKELETRVVLMFGAPEVIHSDNAIGLDSAECGAFYRRYGIRHTKTVSFRPQANGITENFNRFVGINLAIYSKSKKDWDLCVPFLTFAYNSSVNAVTGQTPLFMLIGHDPKMTIDRLIGYEKLMVNDVDHEERLRVLNMIRAKAKQMIKLAQNKRITRAGTSTPTDLFKMGDLVMLLKPQMKRKLGGKLLPRYYGPYRVIGQINPSVFIIMTVKGTESVDIVHVERLKKYHERVDKPYYPPDQRMPILDSIDNPWTGSDEENDSDAEMPNLTAEESME